MVLSQTAIRTRRADMRLRGLKSFWDRGKTDGKRKIEVFCPMWNYRLPASPSLSCNDVNEKRIKTKRNKNKTKKTSFKDCKVAQSAPPQPHYMVPFEGPFIFMLLMLKPRRFLWRHRMLQRHHQVIQRDQFYLRKTLSAF